MGRRFALTFPQGIKQREGKEGESEEGEGKEGEREGQRKLREG